MKTRMFLTGVVTLAAGLAWSAGLPAGVSTTATPIAPPVANPTAGQPVQRTMLISFTVPGETGGKGIPVTAISSGGASTEDVNNSQATTKSITLSSPAASQVDLSVLCGNADFFFRWQHDVMANANAGNAGQSTADLHMMMSGNAVANRHFTHVSLTSLTKQPNAANGCQVKVSFGFEMETVQ